MTSVFPNCLTGASIPQWRKPRTEEPLTNPIAVSSNPADVAILFRCMSEGLPSESGWSWVSPGHNQVLSHHDTSRCRINEIQR